MWFYFEKIRIQSSNLPPPPRKRIHEWNAFSFCLSHRSIHVKSKQFIFEIDRLIREDHSIRLESRFFLVCFHDFFHGNRKMSRKTERVDDTGMPCCWHSEYVCIIQKANKKGKMWTRIYFAEELLASLLSSILHVPTNFLLKERQPRFTPLCLWKMRFAPRN